MQHDIDPRDAAYLAEIAIHRGWDAAAQCALWHLASTGEPFTSDDFRTLMADAPDPHHPNTIGSFFRRACIDGIIEPTGRVKQATTASRHGALIREWRGVPQLRAAQQTCNYDQQIRGAIRSATYPHNQTGVLV